MSRWRTPHDYRFPDDSFDYVFSFIMLHHVVEWEKAIAEAIRVLHPGGWLVGYDVLDKRTFRFLHWLERAEVRLMTMNQFHPLVASVRLDRATLTVGPGRVVVRFRLRKRTD
jgi:ubiquinone/menaquinone biosynthesis C-methylase UbiE